MVLTERRALLLTDVVDSTRLSEDLGDQRMAAVWAAHDRVARDLLVAHDGEYRAWPPRVPIGSGVHAAIAAGVSHIVISARPRSAASYWCQFVTRYRLLWLG